MWIIPYISSIRKIFDISWSPWQNMTNTCSMHLNRDIQNQKHNQGNISIHSLELSMKLTIVKSIKSSLWEIQVNMYIIVHSFIIQRKRKDYQKNFMIVIIQYTSVYI